MIFYKLHITVKRLAGILPVSNKIRISNAEFNVLQVMAEKDIDWTWMILDRTLAVRGIPGFSNVANIVTSLVNSGMVDIVYSEQNAKPRYRVSVQGHQFLSKKEAE